jgi:hypothetical protein
MSTEIKPFKLLLDTHSLKLALAEVAEAYLRLDDSGKSSAAFESARNICLELVSTEVADQAAAAGSAALPVTIPRPASPRTEPPQVAELLVSWCIKKRYRGALLDDLDEVFQRDLTKGMTVARARLRYWGAALHSITPQLLAAAKRIGIFGLITDYARRLLH